MWLYHCTLTEKLPSILKYGLMPFIGPRASEAGETDAAVYLFPDAEALIGALGGWLPRTFGNDALITLLAVDVSDLPVERGAIEFLCHTIIAPDRLRVLSKDVLDLTIRELEHRLVSR